MADVLLNGKWGFAIDSEDDWEDEYLDTEEQAEFLARGYVSRGQEFWIGQWMAISCKAPDGFGDNMGDVVLSCLGEMLPNPTPWPIITDEQECELDTALKDVLFAWMKKHDKYPRFMAIREETVKHLRG